MTHRFFVAEHENRLFLGTSRGEAFAFVTLRDVGGSRILRGTMHPTREAAEHDARRPPDDFEGPVLAVAPLREVTREEALDLGSKASTAPDLYRDSFEQRFP